MKLKFFTTKKIVFFQGHGAVSKKEKRNLSPDKKNNVSNNIIALFTFCITYLVILIPLTLFYEVIGVKNFFAEVFFIWCISFYLIKKYYKLLTEFSNICRILTFNFRLNENL